MQFYEAVDGTGTLHRIPRRIDPQSDLPRILDRLPVRWDHMRPWRYDELVREIELRAGPLMNTIDVIIPLARELHDANLADCPPRHELAWRRAIVLSWNHAQDLEVVLDAFDHRPQRSIRDHDLNDTVRARWLRTRMSSCEEWYERWVESLDPDVMVNVGFLNPNLSASLYNWGDRQTGIQNGMDAHRLAVHHLGNPDAELDWIERAANFVVHHLPREHFGIRHQPVAPWSELEVVLDEDPAMKPHPIGKLIARDVAVVMQALEEYGRITPWHRLVASTDDATFGDYEYALRVVEAAGGDDRAIGSTDFDARELQVAKLLLEELRERAARDSAFASACRDLGWQWVIS